jgi:glucosamine--fructose-6-phosphate aminotransferase (isomerizing)
MYDAIQAQPGEFARLVRTLKVADCAAHIRGSNRTFFVGIGTSYHACQFGRFLFRKLAPALQVRAMHSFDFVEFGPPLGTDDCVVVLSHRGNKLYSAKALERAHQAKSATILITGLDAKAPAADVVLETVPQEASSAHTISYMGAVAALSAIARELGGPDARFLEEEMPELLRHSLATEARIAEFAKAHAARRRIWLMGAGPLEFIAREAALKIKETSYMQAEGMGVEELLHGPFQCTEADDLFVPIAPQGNGRERVLTVARLAKEIGAGLLIVSDTRIPDTDEILIVPEAPAPFHSLTCLVALQLFAYRLALEKGTNPDGFRLEDPRFAKAIQSITL